VAKSEYIHYIHVGVMTMNICIIKDCEKLARSKFSQYCEKHYYRIRRNGTIKLKYKNYSYDKNAFSVLTPNTAWLMGLIWSDGCLSGNSIIIKSKDKCILEQAEKILMGTNLVVPRGRYWDLRLSDKLIAMRLKKMGLIERKSFSIKWPRGLPKCLSWHFIRGEFDGDGCASLSQQNVTSNTPTLSMYICTASEIFANQITAFLKSESIPVHSYCRKNLWTIGINSISGCKKWIEMMYKNSENYLPRKFNICQKWLSIKRPSVGRKKGAQLRNTKKDERIIYDYLYISKTSEKTGKKFNIAPSTVVKILKIYGVKAYTGSFDRLGKKEKQKIKRMRENGMTFKEIQDATKYGRKIIRSVLRS